MADDKVMPQKVPKAPKKTTTDKRLVTTVCGRGVKKPPSADEQEMLEMKQRGETLQTIGNVFGMSRQRVDQILKSRFKDALLEITAPTIRKKVTRSTKPVELTFEDGSTIQEGGVIASMHKYGLTASLSAMLGGKSSKPIYSKAMDAYVIGARFI